MQEVTLQLGHRNLFFGKLSAKFLGQCLLAWVESQEEVGDLLVAGIVQVDMVVGSTWSQKRWVKFLAMISGHE